MSRHFTLFIVVGMLLGLAAGAACHGMIHDPVALKDAAGYFGLITDVFLRLIKMIIAPLVFSTLVGGIAHLGAGSAVGRVGLKTLGLFLSATVISLVVGVAMVSLLRPGSSLHLTAPAATASAGGAQAGLSLKDFLGHVFPTSIIDAMARNEVLQIVVFSTFFGTAMAALGERTEGLLHLIEQVAQVMLTITNYVMRTAPIAVFAAIAGTVTTQGVGILATYAAFVGDFYAALALLCALMFAAAALAVGGRTGALMAAIRQPALIAFSTASSEAAYPRTLEALEAFGVSKRVASFVLPLGYSFNLMGSMMYCTFAVLFIAQAFGVALTGGQIATLVLMLMVTSKGIAGVPRAGLVVVAATLPAFHLPEAAGLALIFGVDHVLDMGRTAVNVIGNATAAAVVARWEGELGPARGPLDAADLVVE
jgi:Na+/H+-dicarboxylate symporter